ncbi:hypothetical protein JCM15415_20870 [Methanobacterium movens]
MNKNKIIIISMLLMGLALFVNMDEAAADASVIYVNATGGNDNWNGQSQFYVNGTTGPKKTINSGTTAVLANGTVNIADGIYSGTGNWGITLTKNMTIQGQSQNNTIIDGSGSRQIFVINSGVNVAMLSLTIQNARPTNTNGGAISNNGGTLTVNNCKFSDNSASSTLLSSRDVYGGAIYNTGNLNIINSVFINNYVERGFWASGSTYGGAIYSNGQMTITNTVFESNYALNRGGAIYNDGSLSVVGSSFNNNYVSGSGHDYNGGAIFNSNSGILSLTGSTFNNNRASVGGALLTFNNSYITGCTFTGNNANNEYGGGAIAWGNTGTPATGTMNVKDSVFTNNRAGYGGAIWSYGTINISGSTFTLNQANYNGGAIRTWGTLNIIGSDLSGNQAGTRGNAISNYQGTTTANFNRLIGSGSILECLSGSINALNNWWGSQTSPASKVNGNVTVSTWLVLNINAVPNPTHTGYTSTITTDLTRNQNGVYFNPASGHVPNGIPVQFTATLGSIPSSSTLVSGSTSRIFTAGTTPGVATVSATVDGIQVNTSINLNPVAALQISQNVNTPVNVGDRVNFQVSVVNNGPNTATNIQIRDMVPVELTNVVVTPSVGNYNMATGIWTINSLNNGSTATLTISGDATIPMAGKTINNTATQISQNEFTPLLPSSTRGVYTKMADVQLSQTGNSPVNVGDTVTYVVTAHNIGPDNATNFIIENKIPEGLLNVVVTPSTGSYLNGNWTVPFLANGDFATLTITGISSADMAGKNTTNTATKIFETEYDPTTIGESVSFDVYTKKANVVLSQTGNYVKDVVTFLVTATNNGPDAATNINIENLIPAGLTNVLVTPNLGTYDISTGIWNIPVLANGAFAVLNITGKAVPQSTVNNTANLTNQTEFNPLLDSNSLSLFVPAVSIYVRNYVANGMYDKWDVNNCPVFVADVQNNGPNDATGVQTTFKLDPGMQFIAFDTRGNGNAFFDPLTNTVTWDIGFMPNGGRVYMNIFFKIIKSGNIVAMHNLTNVNEYNTDNIHKSRARTLSVNLAPVAADIQVNQDVNNTSPVVGDVITISINVTNNGPDDATGVVIKDLLPVGLVFQSADTAGVGSYDPISGLWTIGDLNNGSKVTLTIAALVNASGTIINTASKVAPDMLTVLDYNLNNNAQQVVLTVGDSKHIPTVSIYVRNYVANGMYDKWDVNNCPVFVADVQNNGPNDATGVQTTFKLDPGMQFIAFDTRGNGNAFFDPLTNTVTWDIGFMPNGGRVYMNIFFKIINSGNIVAMHNLTNVNEYNTDNIHKSRARTLSVNLAPVAADIQVNQDVDNTSPVVGDVITISISVTNNGPDDATGVVIKDLLPVGLVFQSADTAGVGSYDPISGLWTIGDLNNGSKVTLTIAALVNASGTIINTASKVAPDMLTVLDYNLNNNAQQVVLTVGDSKHIPTVSTYENYSKKNVLYLYSQKELYEKTIGE